MDEKEKRAQQASPDVITYNSTAIKKKPFTWKKGLIIFGIVFVVIVLMCVGCSAIIGTTASDEVTNFNEPYIGVLHVEGTISEDESSSFLESNTYHHQWLLDRIDDMIKDKENQGLVLFVNTPGGSVYASDELYLKIKEYQKKTGRPVYSYMGSMAASGGYYISSPCDKIIANRNCWTGSVGVTIGTIYDVSGFLKKMGVNTVTITSGKNKAMGSNVEPLTKEQKEIFQGLVDEAYDQFVDIVAQGRHMSVKQVRKLADGRVYTAKQAKKNGLVDDVMTFKQATNDMKKTWELGDCKVQEITYKEEESLTSQLLGVLAGKKTQEISDYDKILALMDANNKFTVTYMSNIDK